MAQVVAEAAGTTWTATWLSCPPSARLTGRAGSVARERRGQEGAPGIRCWSGSDESLSRLAIKTTGACWRRFPRAIALFSAGVVVILSLIFSRQMARAVVETDPHLESSSKEPSRSVEWILIVKGNANDP